MYTIKQLHEIIQKELAKKEYTETPVSLFAPIEYILEDGGKRLRPILMMMAYNLYKEDLSGILKAAVGIEIFHNYTLLHDDVMDNAELRRGRLTVHRKWNTNVAILSGDAAAITAYKYIGHCEDKYLRMAIDGFNQVAMDVCKGQQYDMEFETRDDVTEDEYIHMIYLKTSVLLAGALRHGALVAGASSDEYNALYDLGGYLGLAFQLQDDYLDVYGDVNVFGKKIGGDILINKKTYLLIKALESAKGKDLEDLEGWLRCTNYKPEEKVAAVTDLYNRLGVKESTTEIIEGYLAKSRDVLSRFPVSEDKKQIFYDMIVALDDRQK